MTFMSIVFMFPTTPQSDAPDMNYSVVVLGGVLIISIAWYYFPVYGGVHWFTGPVPNVAKTVVDEGGSLSDKSDDTKGSPSKQEVEIVR